MPDLGTKHECSSCGTKFYDLGKAEPICPKCGLNQIAEEVEEPVVEEPVVEEPAEEPAADEAGEDEAAADEDEGEAAADEGDEALEENGDDDGEEE